MAREVPAVLVRGLIQHVLLTTVTTHLSSYRAQEALMPQPPSDEEADGGRLKPLQGQDIESDRVHCGRNHRRRSRPVLVRLVVILELAAERPGAAPSGEVEGLL